MAITTNRFILTGISVVFFLMSTIIAAEPGNAESEVAALTDAQQLKTLFDRESNPYRRYDYLSQLPAVVKRLGDGEWVGRLLDEALDDTKSDVVMLSIKLIGDIQPDAFVDRLIALYDSVDKGSLALSTTPIRCAIIRCLKKAHSPRISGFFSNLLTSGVTDLFSQEQSETMRAMGEMGNREFLGPLGSYAGKLGTKKVALQRELAAQGKDNGKRSSIEYRISMCNTALESCRATTATVKAKGATR
jgi:hypothetical protein